MQRYQIEVDVHQRQYGESHRLQPGRIQELDIDRPHVVVIVGLQATAVLVDQKHVELQRLVQRSTNISPASSLVGSNI